MFNSKFKKCGAIMPCVVLFFTILTSSSFGNTFKIIEKNTLFFDIDTQTPCNIVFLGEYENNYFVLVNYVFNNKALLIKKSGINHLTVKKYLKKGQGPGEYQEINSGAIDPLNGQIYLFDTYLRRVTIYDNALKEIVKIKTVRKGLSAITAIANNIIWAHNKVYLDNNVSYLVSAIDKQTFKPIKYFLKFNNKYPSFAFNVNTFIDVSDKSSIVTIYFIEKKIIEINPQSFTEKAIKLKTDVSPGIEKYKYKQGEGGKINGKKYINWYQNIANRFDSAIKFDNKYLVLVKCPNNKKILLLFDMRGNQLAQLPIADTIHWLLHWNNKIYIAQFLPENKSGIMLKEIVIQYK